MDLYSGIPMTPSGHDCVVAFVDRLSKRVHFVPTNKSATAEDIADLFCKHVVRLHGVPRAIVSDRDTRFTSQVWKSLQRILGVELNMSTANHPQTDGQTERMFRTLNTMLRSYCSNNLTDWDEYLHFAEFAYNNAYQSTIRCSPFECDLGYSPLTPMDAANWDLTDTPQVTADFTARIRAILWQCQDTIARSQKVTEEYENRKRRPVAFKVGDMVLIHKDHYYRAGRYLKLAPVYFGPYPVTRVVNPNAYEIALPNFTSRHPVINVSKLKRYVRREFYPWDVPDCGADAMARRDEITGIHGIFEADGTQEKAYAVTWAYCDPEHVTMISQEVFEAIDPLVRRHLMATWSEGPQRLEDEVPVTSS